MMMTDCKGEMLTKYRLVLSTETWAILRGGCSPRFKSLASCGPKIQCQHIVQCLCSSLSCILWCCYWNWLCFNDQCIQSVLEVQL